jgi:branched-chain amino acid transport system ATP-binding protein
VPEGRRLFTGMSGRDNLELGSFLPQRASASRRSLEQVLALFPALAQKLRARPARCPAGSSRWWRSAAR